jgi:hypothetical protein
MRPLAALVLFALALGGCRQPGPGEGPADDEAPAAPAPTPAAVTPADFQSLRWLEGQWRGTGDEVAPFYEGYFFVTDTSIRAVMYSDSTLGEVADSSEIVLSGGTLISRGAGSESVATEIDGEHVRFESPPRGLQYTWTRESPTAWTAHLRATILGETQERHYRMERIGDAPR